MNNRLCAARLLLLYPLCLHAELSSQVELGSLREAIALNEPERVAKRLADGADANHIDEHGLNALAYALRYRRPDIARMLLDSGQVKLNPAFQTPTQRTWLHLAAIAGDPELLPHFADGCDPNALDEHGYSPADYAFRADASEMLVALRERGGRLIKVAANRGFPLVYQAIEGHHAREFYQLLEIELTPPPNPDPASTMDPLQFAAWHNNADAVRALLRLNPPLNRTVIIDGRFPATALGIAAARGNHETVRLLLEAGSDPAVSKHLAVHLANWSGAVAAFELLRLHCPNFRPLHPFPIRDLTERPNPREESDFPWKQVVEELAHFGKPEIARVENPGEQAVRLAIVHDDAGADAAALLAAELSLFEDVQLVEREAFQALLAEAVLTTERTPDWLTATHVLHRQSLKLPDGRLLGQWKLVETRSAEVRWIRYELLDGPGTADRVEALAAALYQSLAIGSRDESPRIVLRNVRAPLAYQNKRELEELPWLLTERRLVETGRFVLLDRQLLGLLERERLANKQTEPIPAGAYDFRLLIERSLTQKQTFGLNLTIANRGGEILLNRRFRTETGDVSGLVNQAVKAIPPKLASVSHADPEAEIASAIAEANWALGAQLFAVAEQASETAWSLGGQTFEVACLRALAHAQRVRFQSNALAKHLAEFPQSRIWKLNCVNHPMRPPGALSGRQAIASTTAALNSIHDALDLTPESFQDAEWERWLEDVNAVFDSVRALSGFIHTASDRLRWAAELDSIRERLGEARERLRQLAAKQGTVRTLQAEAACAAHAVWSHKDDAVLLADWNRTVGRLAKSTDYWQRALILNAMRHPFGPRHGRPRKMLPASGYPRTAYQRWARQFLDHDETDVAFLAACLADLIQRGEAGYGARIDRIDRAFLALTETMAKDTRTWAIFRKWRWPSKTNFLHVSEQGASPNLRQLYKERATIHGLASLTCFLSNGADGGFFDDQRNWGKFLFPADYQFLGSEAGEIVKAASQAYATRTGVPLITVDRFSNFSAPEKRRENERKSRPQPQVPTMELTRVWHPFGDDSQPKWARTFRILSGRPVAANGRFWVYGEWREFFRGDGRRKGCVFGVDPETMTASVYPLSDPEPSAHRMMEGKLAVWQDALVILRRESFAALHDFETGKWIYHERFNPALGNPARIGDEVFVFNDQDAKNQSLVGLHLKTGETRVVASSLRHPPESPIDRSGLRFHRVIGEGESLYVQVFGVESKRFVWHALDPKSGDWSLTEPKNFTDREIWAIDFRGAENPPQLRGPAGSAPLSFRLPQTGPLQDLTHDDGKTLAWKLEHDRVIGNATRLGDDVAFIAPTHNEFAIWIASVSDLKRFSTR